MVRRSKRPSGHQPLVTFRRPGNEVCSLFSRPEAFAASSPGPVAVEAVKQRGYDVFLDLKLHDIPNTAAGSGSDQKRGS